MSASALSDAVARFHVGGTNSALGCAYGVLAAFGIARGKLAAEQGAPDAPTVRTAKSARAGRKKENVPLVFKCRFALNKYKLLFFKELIPPPARAEPAAPPPPSAAAPTTLDAQPPIVVMYVFMACVCPANALRPTLELAAACRLDGAAISAALSGPNGEWNGDWTPFRPAYELLSVLRGSPGLDPHCFVRYIRAMLPSATAQPIVTAIWGDSLAFATYDGHESLVGKAMDAAVPGGDVPSTLPRGLGGVGTWRIYPCCRRYLQFQQVGLWNDESFDLLESGEGESPRRIFVVGGGPAAVLRAFLSQPHSVLVQVDQFRDWFIEKAG